MRPIDRVLERFPECAVLARRLYLGDERFRSICEDFALAHKSLRNFEERADADLRPEIDDYRSLIKELEEELQKYLAAAAEA